MFSLCQVSIFEIEDQLRNWAVSENGITREVIYQALYISSREELRREMSPCL
ncbi:hypothetical protein DEDE109153_05805 [Deinococcus deserti]